MYGDVTNDSQLLEEKVAALNDVWGRKKAPRPSAGDDPLAFALRALADAYHLPFAERPFAASAGLPVQERIQRAARVNHWRMRRVRIDDGICRQITAPLLVFAGEEHIPVLALPRGTKGVYHDPQTGAEQPLTPEAAASFAPYGYRLYERLPERALTWHDVFSFAFAGSRNVLACILGVGCIAGLLGLVQPLAVEYITGKIIPAANVPELRQLFFFLSALTVSGALLAVAPNLFLLAFSIRRLERFEAAVFDRLLRLPVEFFRNFEAGDLCTRVISISAIQESVFTILTRQVLGSLFSLFSLLMLFYYSWRLALVGIAVTALYCLVLLVLLRRSLPALTVKAEMHGKMAGLLKQLFDGIAKIRSGSAENRVIARYLDDFTTAARASHAVQVNAGRLALFGVLFPAAVTILLYWLVGDVLRGALDMPQYLAFIAAFGGFQGGVISLCRGVWGLWAIRPELKRIEPILQCDVEKAQGQADPGTLDGELEAAHISFRYAKGQALVLDDVSLSAAPGEFVAIVGPSGCGKSTLVRILLGFEKPEAGGVFYSGRDLALLDVTAVRRQLGAILQNSRVMPDTILNNILSGTEYTLADAEKAIQLAALDRDVASMPMGVFTMVGEGLLSGGQEQRLLIARALVGSPALLIMDESTSALDNMTQDAVRKNIESLRCTRIVIAHRLSTIIHADRIYAMEKGRIVQTGTYASLVKEPGLFQELVRRQML